MSPKLTKQSKKRSGSQEATARSKRDKIVQSFEPKISSQQLDLIFQGCYDRKVADGFFQLVNTVARQQPEQTEVAAEPWPEQTRSNPPNLPGSAPEEEILHQDIPISRYPESTNNLTIALIDEVQLIADIRNYLKNLFTRENIVRLFRWQIQ